MVPKTLLVFFSEKIRKKREQKKHKQRKFGGVLLQNLALSTILFLFRFFIVSRSLVKQDGIPASRNELSTDGYYTLQF